MAAQPGLIEDDVDEGVVLEDNEATGAQVVDVKVDMSSIQRRRNMLYFKREKSSLPAPTPHVNSSYTSPVKDSASNHVPSGPQTRSFVDAALKVELNSARFETHDLSDWMFGSYISTELARDTLAGMLHAGILSIYKVVDGAETLVSNGSTDESSAIEHAYQRALAHGCQRNDVEQIKTPKNPISDVTWKWVWKNFPRKNPVKEKDVVDYLNNVVDQALKFPFLKDKAALYRFAVPKDTTHPFPLAYEPDAEDMRPDFVVLPIEAFCTIRSSTPGVPDVLEVDERYFNFTMIRLPGECKTSDAAQGVSQLQRYVRGTKRAQPWLRFATGMTVTKETASLTCGDGSGLERVTLYLDRGWACIEFLRILLAVVLCDEGVFGKSSHFELMEKNVECRATANQYAAFKARKQNVLLPPIFPPQMAFAASGPSVDPTKGQPSQALGIGPDKLGPRMSSASSGKASTSSQKRKRSKKDDGADTGETSAPPTKKEANTITRLARLPLRIFQHECDGILFNAASIRGRGTCVYVVRVPGDSTTRYALKTSWHDVARRVMQAKVLVKVRASDAHNNHVIVPTETIDCSHDEQEDSTLRIIRGYTSDQIPNLRIEDRVLEVTISALKRPVMYFWSVHDFVMGLRGALLGHAYLVSIGILHRDISENNIVLACHPSEPRGYLIDLDMAVEYTPPSEPIVDVDAAERALFEWNSPVPDSPRDGPFKAERTGTTPYMSAGVLSNAPHTHYDDVESFFYVILLFFLSYRGPLPKDKLLEAHDKGYTQVTGTGRPQHITEWPDDIHRWSDGTLTEMLTMKQSLFANKGYYLLVLPRLREKWIELWGNDRQLVDSLMDLHLPLWKLFIASQSPTGIDGVSHEQFIGVLDRWLKKYPQPMPQHNHCPFDGLY